MLGIERAVGDEERRVVGGEGAEGGRLRERRVAQQGEDGHRLGAADDAHAVDLDERHFRRALPHGIGDDRGDAVEPRQALDARGEVHAVADRGIAEALLGAEIADAADVGVDADAHADLAAALVVEPVERRDHLERGETGLAAVIGDIERRVPEGHDGVAHVLVDRRLVAEEHVGHGREEAVEEARHHLGIEPFGEAR